MIGQSNLALGTCDESRVGTEGTWERIGEGKERGRLPLPSFWPPRSLMGFQQQPRAPPSFPSIPRGPLYVLGNPRKKGPQNSANEPGCPATLHDSAPENQLARSLSPNGASE